MSLKILKTIQKYLFFLILVLSSNSIMSEDFGATELPENPKPAKQDFDNSLDISVVPPFPSGVNKYSLMLNYKIWSNFSVGLSGIMDSRTYELDYITHDYVLTRGILNRPREIALPLSTEHRGDERNPGFLMFGRYYLDQEDWLKVYVFGGLGRRMGWKNEEITLFEYSSVNGGLISPLNVEYNVKPFWFLSVGIGYQFYFNKILDGLFVSLELGYTRILGARETVYAYNDPIRSLYYQYTPTELALAKLGAENSGGYARSSNIFIIPWLGYSIKF
jgi:hypothetical protein